ncbi:MAG: nucleotide excision repair endonuclease [Deltaproteobacteria bacterium]|nr:nucleotide excision repair endonuclease [Deltaproteobacteria bacterium]
MQSLLDRQRLAAAPDEPGVYRFLAADGAVLYVGKAKRLRRRLAAYRTVALRSRRKRDRRITAILRAAAGCEWETTASHLDACLLELRLIQQLRPRFNVSASFSRSYPFIATRCAAGRLYVAFSSRPERLAGYAAFGAFRSREVTAAAFYGLLALLQFVGHKEKARAGAHGFRQIPTAWHAELHAFFAGTSCALLQTLTLSLLERAAARTRRAEVQEHLAALRRFWDVEAEPLRRAIRDTGYRGAYPVPQLERDPLFTRWRLAGESASTPPSRLV